MRVLRSSSTISTSGLSVGASLTSACIDSCRECSQSAYSGKEKSQAQAYAELDLMTRFLIDHHTRNPSSSTAATSSTSNCGTTVFRASQKCSSAVQTAT